MKAGYGEIAIADDKLFNTIVQHRKTVTSLRGIDYSNHVKRKLKIIRPASIMYKWEAEYKMMQENMIIGQSLNGWSYWIVYERLRGELTAVMKESTKRQSNRKLCSNLR